MKTLVKIIKVENNTVTYKEVCRKTGNTMIEDFMSVDKFKKALSSEGFGFELVEPANKAQASKIAGMFGVEVADMDYNRVTKEFSIDVYTDEIWEGLGRTARLKKMYCSNSGRAACLVGIINELK